MITVCVIFGAGDVEETARADARFMPPTSVDSELGPVNSMQVWLHQIGKFTLLSKVAALPEETFRNEPIICGLCQLTIVYPWSWMKSCVASLPAAYICGAVSSGIGLREREREGGGGGGRERGTERERERERETQ